MTDYFNQTNKNIDGGDKEFMIPFLPSSNDAETLENTFKKLTSEKREGLKTQGPGLWVSLKVLQGDLTSMQVSVLILMGKGWKLAIFIFKIIIF